MIPLTPVGVVILGIVLIVYEVTHLVGGAAWPVVWIVVGIVLVVCGLVDLALRGHRIP